MVEDLAEHPGQLHLLGGVRLARLLVGLQGPLHRGRIASGLKPLLHRRIEAQMRRLKSFGDRIASRDPDRQTAEIHTRIALMNRFSALGRAEVSLTIDNSAGLLPIDFTIS